LTPAHTKAEPSPADSQAAGERGQRGVGDVGDADGARDPDALADRARHELQRRERHEVGRDRPRDVRGARVEGVAQLGDQHGEDGAAEGAEEPACVETEAHEAA
jgi:hypothetical protein